MRALTDFLFFFSILANKNVLFFRRYWAANLNLSDIDQRTLHTAMERVRVSVRDQERERNLTDADKEQRALKIVERQGQEDVLKLNLILEGGLGQELPE